MPSEPKAAERNLLYVWDIEGDVEFRSRIKMSFRAEDWGRDSLKLDPTARGKDEGSVRA